MPSKAEKKRRQTTVQAIAKKKRDEAIAAMPITQHDLADLFDDLDKALANGCNGSLNLTRQFLRDRNLPEATIIPWLAEYGGHCDCEVLANVGEAWEE